MAIANITTMTPAEVDNILVEAMTVASRAEQMIDAMTDSNEKRTTQVDSALDVIANYTLSDTEKTYWDTRVAQIKAEIAKGEAIIAEYTPQLAEANATQKECNAEYYRRNGWTRFWIVINSNGHIHSSMNCTTCFPTTQYGWLPNLSGSTNAEVVELAGMSACTICFPDAPVEFRNRPSQIEEPAKKAAREAREAAKAEKDAKAALKAITNPDGTVVKLTGRFGDKIKTLAEAQRVFVNNLESIILDDTKKYVMPNREYLAELKANNEILLKAIVHKRGLLNGAPVAEADVMAEMTKKANVKIKRDWKDV